MCMIVMMESISSLEGGGALVFESLEPARLAIPL